MAFLKKTVVQFKTIRIWCLDFHLSISWTINCFLYMLTKGDQGRVELEVKIIFPRAFKSIRLVLGTAYKLVVLKNF